MRQSIVSRLGRIEAAQRSRVVFGRNKALTDERVRNALALMTVPDSLGDIPHGYEGERARAVIEAAFRCEAVASDKEKAPHGRSRSRHFEGAETGRRTLYVGVALQKSE